MGKSEVWAGFSNVDFQMCYPQLTPTFLKVKTMKCSAQTLKGKQCKLYAEPKSDYCKIHIRQQAFVFDKERNDQAREIWKTLYVEDPLPDICVDMVCGAKNRTGTPCRRKDIYANGRCEFHGGMSTGPRTKQGKERSSQNLPGVKKTFYK